MTSVPAPGDRQTQGPLKAATHVALLFETQWVLTVAAWPIMPLYAPIAGIPFALYAVSYHCSRRIALLALLASLIPNGLAATVPLLASFIPVEVLAAERRRIARELHDIVSHAVTGRSRR